MAEWLTLWLLTAQRQAKNLSLSLSAGAISKKCCVLLWLPALCCQTLWWQCSFPVPNYEWLNGVVVVQLLIHVWLFVTPWITACQASLSSTISWSLLKSVSTESVIVSNHLIFCRPLLLLPSIFPSIRVFSNELALCLMWPKYWSFSSSTVTVWIKQIEMFASLEHGTAEI